VVETIEIKLPAYRKSTANYFKIFSEDRCIKVSLMEGWEEISQTTTQVAFMYETESNEQEFLEAYKKAQEILNSLILDPDPESDSDPNDPDTWDEDEYQDNMSDLVNRAHEQSEGMER